MLRLSDLAQITPRTRESIRNMTKAKTTPWEEKLSEGTGQRRYDGFHALALTIQDSLSQQGLSLPAAAEVVDMNERKITAFLDAEERGENPVGGYIACMRVREEDDRTGEHWFLCPVIGTGSAEEIAEAVLNSIKRIGEVTPTLRGSAINRRTSGPHLSVVSIREESLKLRAIADEAGYEIHGRSIQKKTGGQ